jgi:electron transport complex protein RnfC
MSLFLVRGGVKLSYRKELTSESAIVRMPPPKRVLIPLQQHVGSPAEPVVQVGNRVGKGQLIGKPGRGISAAVHASTSGTVVAIEERTAPHPSGLTQLTVVIESRWRRPLGRTAPPMSPASFRCRHTQDMSARVAAAGIVGLGGAAFPSAVKLDMRQRHELDTLVINGAECEPYVTCDDRLMREAAERDHRRRAHHGLRAGGGTRSSWPSNATSPARWRPCVKRPRWTATSACRVCQHAFPWARPSTCCWP